MQYVGMTESTVGVCGLSPRYLLPVPISHPEHIEAHDGRLPGALYLDVVVGSRGSTVRCRSVH